VDSEDHLLQFFLWRRKQCTCSRIPTSDRFINRFDRAKDLYLPSYVESRRATAVGPSLAALMDRVLCTNASKPVET